MQLFHRLHSCYVGCTCYSNKMRPCLNEDFAALRCALIMMTVTLSSTMIMGSPSVLCEQKKTAVQKNALTVQLGDTMVH